MKASFSLQSGSFLLLASFLFNVNLPSSPGQTVVSLARLVHVPFIIFPRCDASQLPPAFCHESNGQRTVLFLHWDGPWTASDQSSADECGWNLRGSSASFKKINKMKTSTIIKVHH